MSAAKSSPEAKLTPMLKQFKEVKDKHPDKLILFRMGDFYETFFDDAYTASKTLNITLTTRDKNSENPVPLAGFPYHALEHYLDKLIKAGLKVVICEQTEAPKKAVGLVNREVVEIITPGTILDNSLIEGAANNFLCSVYYEKTPDRTGLASLDLSTGDFSFTQLWGFELANELLRLKPSEIIVDGVASEDMVKGLKLEYQPTLTIFDNWQFRPTEAAAVLKKHFGVHSLEAFGAHDKRLGATAAGAALAYVQSLYQVPLSHISGLSYYSLENFMQLDEVTRRNLELLKSLRYGNRAGSLIAVLDQTQTPMGARLLQNWLLHPLLRVKEIEARLDMLEGFFSNTAYLKDVRNCLRDIGDISRLVSRLGALRINPRELLSLRSYLFTALELRSKLALYKNDLPRSFSEALGGFAEMIATIEAAIRPNPPLTVTEGGIFNAGYDKDLDELLEIIHDGKSWIARL